MIDKIEMYVTNRMIRPAELCAAEFGNDCSGSPLKESGYAILSIMLPYFEMIQQFISGQDSDGHSKDFFRDGFKSVYPCTPLTDDNIKKELYPWVRCGMFHAGMTRGATRLSRCYCFGFERCGSEIFINPARVVDEIKVHFKQYIARLRNPANLCDRAKFQAHCTTLGVDQTPVAAVSSSQTPCMPNPWANG
jgi:hypothetical protein